MTRLAALLATLTFCLPLAAQTPAPQTPAPADQTSRQAKAAELVTLLHTDRMVNQISESLKRQLADQGQRAIGLNPTPESKDKLTDAEKKFADIVDAQVGWSVLGPAFTEIYAKAFTEDEMNGIIAFYKSPAGIAFLANTPIVNQQIQQITRPRLDQLQAQLRKSVDELHSSQTAIPLAPQ